MPRRTRSLEERFWPKVNKNGPVPEYRPDLGQCWIWIASFDRKGYGQVYVGTGREDAVIRRAHVISYLLCVGPVPEGLELDHLCRVRACVNPAHLDPVTHQANMLRGENVASWASRKTHCPQGHPYDEENTRYYKGDRRCKACDRNRQREIRRLRREKRSSGSS